jgi:hypothetical protein
MTLLPLGLLASVLSAGEPAAKKTAPEVVVLAKGTGYIVHGLGGESVLPASAATVLHTALPAGTLQVLVRSGTTVGIPVSMATDRYPTTQTWPITQTRIAGVAADAERVYVLVWSASWKFNASGAAGPQVKPPESDAYTLKTFWLADGSEVGSFAVGGDRRPKTVPPEKFEPGPLAAERGTVTVYGQTFRFEGKKRVK